MMCVGNSLKFLLNLRAEMKNKQKANEIIL
jgi:hypothetical protein